MFHSVPELPQNGPGTIRKKLLNLEQDKCFTTAAEAHVVKTIQEQFVKNTLNSRFPY